MGATRQLLQEHKAASSPLYRVFNHHPPAIVVLEDGTIFNGYSFGAPVFTNGEVVFSTSMVGYPEALTDPSYRGQILCLTYPLVGNYGVPSYDTKPDGLPLFFESHRIQPRGLIVHELCERPSHRLSTRTLDRWLLDEGIPGVYGIDARRLARVIRERGVMLAAIITGNEVKSVDFDRIENPNNTNLVKEVSVQKPIVYHGERENRINLIDCGVKLNIIRNLLKRDVAVIRVPHDASISSILEYRPLGVVISNGPGDPRRCDSTILTVRALMESNTPILGICLGTQLIALAAGADTYKMKYGHRSQNQPVLDIETGRCYITTQNHGFAVDRPSLEKAGFSVWYINANDKSVEGLRHPRKPCWAVQWHPEGSPGPTDTEPIFDHFLKEAINHGSR
jgi:carbamoyl-phosphate synthase small subunit